jgi:DNA topoisomerase-1
MNLVICEKNIAASRIASILSNGTSKQSKIGSVPIYEFSIKNEPWTLIGLKGHIINLDYPSTYSVWWRVAPRKLISVDPEKKVSEKGIASALKKVAKNTSRLIVATDFDREGELIGIEALDLIKSYNESISHIKRARYSAITPSEIHDAFNNLAQVDRNLSSAGESRQIIDLTWGAVLTRFISLTANKVGKEFLSIGRVQSPTLTLLVEKEKEIQSFRPKPFWKIIAHLNKSVDFDASHNNGKFWDENIVTTLFEKIKNSKKATVTSVEKKRRKESPPPPFNTTSFIQASSSLRISASQAMSIAEELYMNGVISYPRTDNTVYPKTLDIQGILTKLTKSDYKKEVNEVLTNPRSTPTRGKKKTTDHPPIHPVDVPKTPLNGMKKKVYELIVRRFLATLSQDAVSESVKVMFDISSEPFSTKGYRLIEPHWKGIYNYFTTPDKVLPDLEKNEIINIVKMALLKDETKPPKRYTQGSLIAKMEELSLGTKSTRHEIIKKLYDRKYITLSPLAPTYLGMAVIDAMSDCDVVKPKMTAQLEDDMNLIAEGKKTLEETVQESREMLTVVMKELEKDKDKIKKSIREADRKQNTIGTCEQCGKDLLIRTSRKGKRFVGCSGYPNCKNTYPLPQRGMITATGLICETCKTPILKVKTAKKKPWELCLDPNCEKSKKEKE